MRELLRGTRYLLGGLPSAVATLFAPPLLAVVALSSGIAGLGLFAFPRATVVLRRWAEWHRRRAAAYLGVTVTPRDLVLGKGLRAQWRQVLDDPEVRRDARWTLRQIVTGIPAGLAGLALVGTPVFTVVAAPLWWLFPADEPLRLLAGIPVTGWGSALGLAAVSVAGFGALSWWAVPRLAGFHARGCVAALEPTAEELLTERVGELTESRAGVLDAHGAELRRIERDLHDGTQARLVAIAMRLGVARESLPDDAGALAKLLQEAHEGAEEAMTELREVIRTMYPPILADRGLEGALAALTARAGVPAEVELQDLSAGGASRRGGTSHGPHGGEEARGGELGKLPASVEAAAYFIVAETLTNAAKHSGATRVLVRLTRDGGRLLVEVTDDGIGGVNEALGTGVVGIRRRVAALDGTVLVSSPAGGPTAITVELPCAS
ncbi:sensor histidine kinase [Nonomuraea sp. NPDC026600]|uniref:sensor histidine kinase n=1 Tax=Nonomuraea sp. NPDC026600 TaxID=3155363 RepID=UPI00340D2406